MSTAKKIAHKDEAVKGNLKRPGPRPGTPSGKALMV